MERFIKCLCDGNLQALVIEGTPPQAEIERAWFGIYSKYIDLSQTTDIKYTFRLQNDIYGLTAKINRIDLCIKYLSVAYDQEIVDILKGYGYNRAFDWNDQEAFTADLKAVASRAQKLVIQLQAKQLELDSYQDSQKGEKPDRVYFTKILMRLSDHAGYGLKASEISVSEFAIRKQEYIEHLERQAKK